MSAPRLSDDIKGSILAEYVAGIKTASIANKYGVDRSYPSILAKRRGHQLRSPDEKRAKQVISARLRARGRG